MDDGHLAAFAAWFIDAAGLSGQNEETMVTEFCTGLVADGLPLARGQVFIDTPHSGVWRPGLLLAGDQGRDSRH
jgi:hypothetical protein